MLSYPIVAGLLLTGATAGFLAGLLGIGGGLIIVPAMLIALKHARLGGLHTQHLAVGTSFAVMVFTSCFSVWTHHRNHAVEWRIVRRMVMPIVLGTLLGTQIAAHLPSHGLQWLFVAYAYSVALQLVWGFNTAASHSLPRNETLWGISILIGILASFVGIGGGTISVPFLTWCNIVLPRAIATSAALGWPIALSGAIGYLISGWNVSQLPWGAIGFIYLPAALILLSTTVLTAPLGAKLAHILPVAQLKKIFALLMVIIASDMLLNTLLPR